MPSNLITQIGTKEFNSSLESLIFLGYLVYYKLEQVEDTLKLSQCDEVHVCTEGLALSLDWSCGITER